MWVIEWKYQVLSPALFLGIWWVWDRHISWSVSEQLSLSSSLLVFWLVGCLSRVSKSTVQKSEVEKNTEIREEMEFYQIPERWCCCHSKMCHQLCKPLAHSVAGRWGRPLGRGLALLLIAWSLQFFPASMEQSSETPTMVFALLLGLLFVFLLLVTSTSSK